MIIPISRLTGLALLAASVFPTAGFAQYEYRYGYNPYTGTRGDAAAAYNPYTGTRGAGQNA